MNSTNPIRQIILFIIYVFVQAFFAKNLELFGLAFCFIYINYLLIYPIDVDKVVFLLIGFGLGFVIDIFYDTLGIHSAACVLIAYIRPFVIRFMTTKQELFGISIKEAGLRWFFTYSLILVSIHHLVLFILQRFNFQMFGGTLLKVIASTAMTVFVVIIIQYSFYSPYVNHARK